MADKYANITLEIADKTGYLELDRMASDISFQVNEKKLSQYIMFSILYFTSFILNSIVHDFVYLISNLTLISFLCATIVSTITNFTGQKFLIFKNKK